MNPRSCTETQPCDAGFRALIPDWGPECSTPAGPLQYPSCPRRTALTYETVPLQVLPRHSQPHAAEQLVLHQPGSPGAAFTSTSIPGTTSSPSWSAGPWLANPPDKTAALRQGNEAGARLWRTNGPILRAIVENWQSKPRLRADPAAPLAAQDVPAVASGLPWLGERLYSLAACGIPPFDDENALVNTLVHIWVSTLYGRSEERRVGKEWRS